MEALVTGGAGFIGSHLVDALLEEGWSVRILDNFLTGREENVNPKADLVRGDLRDYDTVREACRDIEVVFHQAALRSIPKSIDMPQLSMECNVTGTLNVLMAAEETGVRRVVYASSSSVYGGSEGEASREDMAPHPRSPYAASKLAAEYYCRVWTELKGLSTMSLRYFNVFGPRQLLESKYAVVFPAFIVALLNDQPPEVHWDGEQRRDFTYIDDVVRANILAANADARVGGEVFNIGGGAPKSINEVLKAVSDALGKWIDPIMTPKRPGDVRLTHADNRKGADLLGWGPRAAWPDAIERTTSFFASRSG